MIITLTGCAPKDSPKSTEPVVAPLTDEQKATQNMIKAMDKIHEDSKKAREKIEQDYKDDVRNQRLIDAINGLKP